MVIYIINNIIKIAYNRYININSDIFEYKYIISIYKKAYNYIKGAYTNYLYSNKKLKYTFYINYKLILYYIL